MQLTHNPPCPCEVSNESKFLSTTYQTRLCNPWHKQFSTHPVRCGQRKRVPSPSSFLVTRGVHNSGFPKQTLPCKRQEVATKWVKHRRRQSIMAFRFLVSCALWNQSTSLTLPGTHLVASIDHHMCRPSPHQNWWLRKIPDDLWLRRLLECWSSCCHRIKNLPSSESTFQKKLRLLLLMTCAAMLQEISCKWPNTNLIFQLHLQIQHDSSNT